MLFDKVPIMENLAESVGNCWARVEVEVAG